MKIAITGTIGSGKSMVSDYLRSKELYVFDCDKYNSYLIENDKNVFEKIYKEFPNSIDHLKVNKKKLAAEIFNNPEKKQILEDILHPLIFNKMIEESKKYDLFFAEVPLLFEKNLDKYFDLSLLIVANEKNSHYRLAMKGYSEDEIKNREIYQLPIQEKIKKSKEIIYNNGSYKDLYKQIDRLLYKYDWE